MAFQQVVVQQQGAPAVMKPPPMRQDMNEDGTEQIQTMTSKLVFRMVCFPCCCPIIACKLCLNPTNQRVSEMDGQRLRIYNQQMAVENLKPGTVIVAESRVEIPGLDFAFNPAAPIGALPGGMPQQVYAQILQEVYDEVKMKPMIGQQKLTEYAEVTEERLRGRRSTQQHAFQQLAERYAAQGIELRLDWCPMQVYLTRYKLATHNIRVTLREPVTLHIVIRGVSQNQPAMPQSPPTYTA